ncbi:quinoprotein dehydrogenase-associated putative ABC transporter substrate-binding protein [Teichococcus vastitatis]|jgi:quinoprotein dehydrogenase-associated probable ABC transporter substrate-binding protein|uniref:Quinoprotein dehydrogenase-associated putative ABC transporter substrate-binding protein n=1 Tax=Teichococcus vastitatis TaxID=2307076 RepID=A0ABS9VYZ5_9PROT|nr:quinoprotein dehydrogenase-associated putative ABC transporter substrate-binding protein [Pseudoroseomonas vastitatis]MCI0752193.1 quinoprotein dehydrogenase-associated putative ABC transporter substrate-binding protein [Pseudoroseomonas vastitatis]
MRSAALALAALLLVLPPPPARAQTAELVPPDELRVCADPANLPFSNERGEGFENRIALILGEAMGLPVRSVFFPQVQGFVRNTLGLRRCDLVMGTVASDELMQNTNPYYHTTYVAVFRKDAPPPADLGDPAARNLRFGVVARTPPVDLLLRNGLLDRTRSYALAVDTRVESPASQMLRDVASGELDVALVWGPIAGYQIHVQHLPLGMRALPGAPGAARMDYRITMGVRANEPQWRRRVNAAIREKQPEIDAVLREYGVPMLDAAGRIAAGVP